MAKSLKELVALSQGELIAMGASVGLTFHNGMRKVDMAQQLQITAASGWMEVNQDLMSGIEESYDGGAGMFSDQTTLSDAAHMAQIISGAGFTETFHAAMNGPSNHLEAVNAYLGSLGVSSGDVWMHMPKANPNIPARHWGALNEYLRDGLSGHQDIMPELSGHYSSNIMDEFSTNQGGVQQSYEYLAHMYVDRSQYNSPEMYGHDISNVASRLQSQMGGRFKEVAFASAVGAPTAYINSLPQLGDSSIVSGVQHPRSPLNVSGLPLGSFGAGINPDYSLSASLTGSPGWSDASKAIYSDVSAAAKSLARVYSGGSDIGLSVNSNITSDRDMILDSASRYADISDVRNGYDNLKRSVGDDPRYSGAAIRAVLENANDYNQAETSATFDPAERIRAVMASSVDIVNQTGSGFTTNFGAPTFSNPAFERREAKRIADLDASHANFRNVDDYGTGRSSSNGPQFHSAFEQGTPEWLAFREQYDITGSTVGSYLGHNRYTNPIKEMSDKLGFKGDFTQNADMIRGHRLEPIARSRVSSQYGFDIGETGAITNPDFPRMMYSPDGLIGDDALWEHKAPRKFFDLNDHQDYIDQVQLGMHLSGRSRTLFSQTVGDETRSQWINRDDSWFSTNENKLMSTLGRMDAGRSFINSNQGMSADDLKAGVRQTMTGEGIWGFQTNKTGNDYYTAGVRGMSRFSPNAGSDADPFLSSGRTSFDGARTENQYNDYQPNWTFGGRSQPNPELLGIGYNPNVTSDPSSNPLANAVKSGILAAQEENRQRGTTQNVFDGESKRVYEDADFTDDPFSPNNGGGRGGGGGRNPPPDRNWFTGGTAGGDIVRGLAGGSLSSFSSGMFSAMSRTPWGLAATAAIGAVSIGNEVAENINEFVGQAEDAGVDNPNAYSAMNLGLQQMGLSEQQAGRINATTHSAFNTLLNGDPSGAVRIVQGTRGLLTIGDIREAQGDPVRLAAIASQRGRERGWSQQRIAGAMQMAGLDGLARASSRGEYAQNAATATVRAGEASDYAEGVGSNMVLQANRADMDVAQNALQASISHGAPVLTGATNAIIDARSGARNVYDFIMGEESGGDPNARSSTSSAYGSMQVLSGTRSNPGFDVRPASNDSPEEAARVGRDYYDAMLKRYKDPRKAMAAYTDGPATVDSAIGSFGDDWLSHMPAQAQKRVSKYDDWVSKGDVAQEGASGFTRAGASYGQVAPVINVNIDAKVNNQQATATVSAGNGQTVTQQINMGNGVSQRR